MTPERELHAHLFPSEPETAPSSPQDATKGQEGTGTTPVGFEALREAQAKAWDEGHRDVCHDCCCRDTNPYRAALRGDQ